MDEAYKSFSINFYNRLKNTINASIKCKIDEHDNSKLNIEINRLGLQYNTSITGVNDILDDKDKIDIEFDKVVKKYRSFVKHKFFY